MLADRKCICEYNVEKNLSEVSEISFSVTCYPR